MGDAPQSTAHNSFHEINMEITVETKQLLKDLLIFVGENEVLIEKQRKLLCRMSEFEPYTTFLRIANKCEIGKFELQKYML
jgi:hypothetical protein